ncbi:winged helix DNA-binding protein [Dyella halodurans]|uniref:MarR family winged helix-turn-helix transcriptional regulator n=1 Tax=Dyella halodurans TaxID=1920171 RepID=A0ABV9C9A8_9GAMM|nr:winged helix DNA-binding protein [Dyella halodurans]
MTDDDSTSEQNFPTPYLREAYLRRFPLAAAQRLETVFTLKLVGQQINNVLNTWLEGTAGSPARFMALAVLWGAGGRPVPHQEIIAALQVKRATVSALMFSLEQDGFVQSIGDEKDRRRLLATLTDKGKQVITSAMELNAHRLEKVFVDLSPDELGVIRSLLRRMRDGFVKVSNEKD